MFTLFREAWADPYSRACLKMSALTALHGLFMFGGFLL